MGDSSTRHRDRRTPSWSVPGIDTGSGHFYPLRIPNASLLSPSPSSNLLPGLLPMTSPPSPSPQIPHLNPSPPSKPHPIHSRPLLARLPLREEAGDNDHAEEAEEDDVEDVHAVEVFGGGGKGGGGGGERGGGGEGGGVEDGGGVEGEGFEGGGGVESEEGKGGRVSGVGDEEGREEEEEVERVGW